MHLKKSPFSVQKNVSFFVHTSLFVPIHLSKELKSHGVHIERQHIVMQIKLSFARPVYYAIREVAQKTLIIAKWPLMGSYLSP